MQEDAARRGGQLQGVDDRVRLGADDRDGVVPGVGDVEQLAGVLRRVGIVVAASDHGQGQDKVEPGGQGRRGALPEQALFSHDADPLVGTQRSLT
jgi:hypothetical protein